MGGVGGIATCSFTTIAKCARRAYELFQKPNCSKDEGTRLIMANRIEALRAMLERNPSDSRALFGIAAEYEKLSDWQQVVTCLEQYLATAEDQGNAWGRLAMAYLELGQSQNALSAYQRGAEQARRHGHPSMAAEFDEAIGLIDS